MTERNIVLRLPAIYAEDRSNRDLPMGEVMRQGMFVWTVSLDEATVADMISDARHYAEGGMDMAPADVVRSAKRALAVLLKIQK